MYCDFNSFNFISAAITSAPTVFNCSIVSDNNVGSDISSQTKSSFTKDAEIAMINLGYKPQQAARAIAQALKVNPEINDSEELIRFSLKSMI